MSTRSHRSATGNKIATPEMSLRTSPGSAPKPSPANASSNMKSIRSQRTANHDVEKSTTPDLLAGQTRDWTPVQPETLDAESESFGSPTPCRESSPEIANEEKDAKVLPTLDFIFDTGNIRILVKLNDIVREGRVSSSSMIQASPVWRKLLSPTQDEDVEELRHSIKRIDCTEDDSEALLILLNICHLNFQEVPHGVGYELLLLLALLCDKYDCVSLVQPWLTNERWLMQESEESMLPGKEGWLRIAQIFELEVVFDKLVKHMARNVYGSIGDADADHATESLTLVPHDIKQRILACRRSMIIVLLNVPYDLLERYRNRHISIGSDISLCNWPDRGCDRMAYGTIVLCLAERGLHPRPQPENVSMSVSKLAQVLRDVAEQCTYQVYKPRERLHVCGGLWLKAGIDRAFSSFDRDFGIPLRNP